MISKHAISSGAGAASYHEKALSTDGASQQADNYYSNEKAMATWQGKGAEVLGIEGKVVTREEFVQYLDGKLQNPATGKLQDLALNSRGEDRRAGWDFTISAPKSVSIVGLVGGDERVVEAHKAANARAMEWLQEHASQIRVKDAMGENVKVTTGNLLWATVQHETSRSNEPQLHNHNVIVAVSYDQERGTWRSLTNDELFTLRAGADSIYKTSLAKELVAAGYELVYTKDAVNFEIKGITQAQLETYSTRSQEIDAALEARGLDPKAASWESRQAATLDTRSAKEELPRDVMHEVWKEKAQESHLAIDALVKASKDRVATNGIEDLKSGLTSSAMHSVSWAIEHLSEREQAYKVSELEKVAVEFGGQDVDSIKAAIGIHRMNGNLVELNAKVNGTPMLTTSSAIDAENTLRNNIQAGIGKGRAILADDKEFTSAVSGFEARKSQETGSDFRLSAEQLNAARNMLMHKDAYQGIQGDAGTGKTAAMEFVQEVATSKGWVVQGVAVSGTAARELEKSSGIPSQTLARMFATRDVAMRHANSEISRLTAAVAEQKPSANGDRQRYETRKLEAKAQNITFGVNRYTFDHQKADVFRTGNDGLRGKLGEFLLDVADRMKRDGGTAPGYVETLRDRLQDGIAQRAQHVGLALGDYQKVGLVEAIAARSALYEGVNGTREMLLGELNSKKAELHNLMTKGNIFGSNTLLVMDETSMGGVKDLAKYSNYANSIGARVGMQGDIKQHGSVAAGRAFEQSQLSGMNVSVLQETRRFDNATPEVKLSLELMKQGKFGAAMAALDYKEVKQDELANVVADRYLANLNELRANQQSRNPEQTREPTIGVVAVTNQDRKDINQAVHAVLQKSGDVSEKGYTKPHLDNLNLTVAERRTVSMLGKQGAGAIVFGKAYKELGVAKGDVVTIQRLDIAKNLIHGETEAGKKIVINPDAQSFFKAVKHEVRSYAVGDKVETRAAIQSPSNDIGTGSAGVIQKIGDQETVVKWADGKTSTLNNKEVQFMDLAYARTSYKEQGATNDREIIALSEVGAKVYGRLASYVASTRARDNTELVTSDRAKVIANADKVVVKTIATYMGDEKGIQVVVGRSPNEDLAKALAMVTVNAKNTKEYALDLGSKPEPVRSTPDPKEKTRDIDRSSELSR